MSKKQYIDGLKWAEVGQLQRGDYVFYNDRYSTVRAILPNGQAKIENIATGTMHTIYIGNLKFERHG